MKFGRQLPEDLRELQIEMEGYAREYGLDFFPTIFEVLDYDQINQVAAYGGFPVRYPHWRFGMDYERLSKGYTYGLQKIYEMVINNNPCYAYLLESNSYIDQKIVMAHVFGHCDFFKNNEYFKHTNRRMIDEMANHAIRIRRYIDRYGIDRVEEFIDTCLSLDNLIDYYSPYFEDMDLQTEDEDENDDVPRLLNEREYMEDYINPASYIEAEREKLEAERAKKKRFPRKPVKDVMWFLMKYAPLTHWQRDVISIIREESYYFAPQGQTKILNEGWACLAPDSWAFTGDGMLSMAEVVWEKTSAISDGESIRGIYGRNIIPDHPMVTLKTRRGLEISGSNNHRVLLPDGETWKRLDEFSVGDAVGISGGAGLWAQEKVKIDWKPAQRVSLHDIAEKVGVSVWTVIRHRKGKTTQSQAAIAAALEVYETPENQELSLSLSKRQPIEVPEEVDVSLGAFLGYLIGDGHISRVKGHLGLTSGDEEQALTFLQLAQELFGVTASFFLDENRWRVLVHSKNLMDFLQETFNLTDGPSAGVKKIPKQILRSPEPVIRAFLRAYFDSDGYAGKQGVILSTKSDELSEQTQLLLLNYGILSRRRKLQDGCWHVHVAGASARVFSEKIGFGLVRKQEALDAYVNDRKWFKKESWTDEIVSIEHGQGDVYDISVEETHRYAAQGFINHNSYWHAKIMTEKAAKDSEIIDFADAHAGVVATSRTQLNPYKLGIELLRDIEERWNKGQFGKEYDECDSLYDRNNWDLKLGKGQEKIFQVRRIYNDVTFIDEFLTPEFCMRHNMFGFDFNRSSGQYEISTRDFKEMKEKLLFQLTNFGQPFIRVVDANFENRSELLLGHRHEGVDLRVDYARAVLENLFKVWKRPTNISTRIEGKGRLFSYDGKEHSIREFDHVDIRD
ncbi:MAG TPA: SpoVR family protein [Myxococcales bacterium]|nr:SpoVR family protein [Deltaproteobacteria bacterium]MBU48071.1 SpoVR family protein [Deltaproteobacteria bacterium]HAA53225.1 SpoVR family protein [Myxococcales bacterium]|tara:strand:- start:8083 stop:10794 length:2712 start_codon:yes stop_codon:yes gene_type:complete